jgi:NAD(P)-dependent dehydrogenase (short-subunit alcohol dehydrogenase family)
MKIAGAVAVITGGARRLGRQMALALAQEGADIVVNYRSSKVDAQETGRQVEAVGRRALCVQADVSQAAEAQRLLEATLAELGRADILIANASTFHRTPIESVSERQWDDLIDNNLRAAFMASRAFGLWMQEHGGGVILMLADTAGLRPWLGLHALLGCQGRGHRADAFARQGARPYGAGQCHCARADSVP